MIGKIPGGIPKTGIVPKGDLVVVLGKWDRENRTQDGRIMPKIDMKVVEPASVAGIVHFEQFCLGTHEDPDADEPKTWKTSFGCRNLHTMAAEAGVESKGLSADELLDALEGQQVGISMNVLTEPETIKSGPNQGEPNPYAGQERNRISAYWTPGKREPKLATESGGGAAAASAKAKASAPKRPAPAEVEEEPDETPPPKPKPAAKPAPKKPAPVEEEVDEEAEEEAPAPPPKRGRPPKVKEPEPEPDEAEEVEEEDTPPPPKKPKGGTAEVQLPCPYCNAKVARSAFEKHIIDEHPDAEE